MRDQGACLGLANNPRTSGGDKGIALYHVGVASQSAGETERAAGFFEESFVSLRSDAYWVPDTVLRLSGTAREQREAAWRAELNGLKFDRVIRLSKAYRTLGRRTDAIRLLESERAVIDPFVANAEVGRGAAFDQYYLTLANLYAEGGASASTGDQEAAIDNYLVVVRSPRRSSAEVADARKALEEFAVALGADALVRENDEDDAIRFYGIAREANGGSSEALLGLGQARLRLGERRRDLQELVRAEDDFTQTIGLGTVLTNAQRAAAFEGRGRTRGLQIELNPRLSENEKAQRLLLVQSDYARAAEADASSNVFGQLAETCARNDEWACAEENFGKAAAKLMGENANGALIAEALLNQANAMVENSKRTGISPDLAALRGILEDAKSRAPRQPLPVLRLAQFHFDQGDNARSKAVIAPLASDRADRNFNTVPTEVQAEAFSLLSAINALTGELPAAVANADKASDLDPRNQRYDRIACLARVRAGWPSTKPTDEPRCTTGLEPTDFLLRAMYFMRRAQSLSNSEGRAARRTAQAGLEVALENLDRDPGVTDFEWPRPGEPVGVPTDMALIYLNEAALACNGSTGFNLPDDGRNYETTAAFFDYYRARRCDNRQ